MKETFSHLHLASRLAIIGLIATGILTTASFAQAGYSYSGIPTYYDSAYANGYNSNYYPNYYSPYDMVQTGYNTPYNYNNYSYPYDYSYNSNQNYGYSGYDSSYNFDPNFFSYGRRYNVFLSPDEIYLALAIGNINLSFANANANAPMDYYYALPQYSGPHYNDNYCGQSCYGNLSAYRQAMYHDVYPGIDSYFSGQRDDFYNKMIVNAGADPRQIIFDLRGAKNVSINQTGDLIVQTDRGPIILPRPHAYQTYGGNQTSVPINYRVVDGTRVSFDYGSYNNSYPFYIDPFLNFNSTYNGMGIRY